MSDEAVVGLIACVVGTGLALVGTGFSAIWVLGTKLGKLETAISNMHDDIERLFAKAEATPCQDHHRRIVHMEGVLTCLQKREQDRLDARLSGIHAHRQPPPTSIHE